MSRNHSRAHKSKIFKAGLAATALALSACGASASADESTRDDAGNVVEAGEVGVFVMQVGDCYEDFESGLIETLEAQPCAQEHGLEVYAKFDMPAGVWPGEDAVDTAGIDGCYDRFEGYVGASYEVSVFDYTFLSPTEESWSQIDDREIVCVLARIDGEPNLGTAKGSAI